MAWSFEWNRRKASDNLGKHGVSFAEAATVFGDSFSITVHDPDHSTGEEDRFITVGESARNRLLVVVHCDRGDRIRLISARETTRRERRQHEESI